MERQIRAFLDCGRKRNGSTALRVLPTAKERCETSWLTSWRSQKWRLYYSDFLCPLPSARGFKPHFWESVLLNWNHLWSLVWSRILLIDWTQWNLRPRWRLSTHKTTQTQTHVDSSSRWTLFWESIQKQVLIFQSDIDAGVPYTVQRSPQSSQEKAANVQVK